MSLSERYLDIAERVFNPSGKTDKEKRLLLQGAAGAAALLALALAGCGSPEITPTPTPKNVFLEPKHQALEEILGKIKRRDELQLVVREQTAFRPADGIRTDVFNATQSRVINPELLIQFYNWVIELGQKGFHDGKYDLMFDYNYLKADNKTAVAEKMQFAPLVSAQRILLILPKSAQDIIGLQQSTTILTEDRKRQPESTVYSYVFMPDGPDPQNTDLEQSSRANLTTEIIQSLINANLGLLGSSGEYNLPQEAFANSLATAIEYRLNGIGRNTYVADAKRGAYQFGRRTVLNVQVPDVIFETIPQQITDIVLQEITQQPVG